MTTMKGKVILAGAGPGDPELITIRLQQRLAVADVIIADRLVNPAIIQQYASAAARIESAAKQGYAAASMPQETINQLILQYALEGKTVLRLKGGDIAFFSNVLDELQTLAAHGIDYEIIPGITAASGASAMTGIPLTARGYAQGVQFLSFNPNSYFSPDHWKALARSNDTLVFYMAAKNVIDLAELLLRYTKKPATPVAVIEQATTVYQRVHIAALDTCSDLFAGIVFSSPSLVIVGEVVRLHENFNWFRTESRGSVFSALVS